MGKRYLNASERMQCITISAFIGQLEKTAKTWSNLKRNKNNIKYLKMAGSFAQKVLDNVFDECGAEELQKTYTAVHHSEFTLNYEDTRLKLNKKEIPTWDVTKSERDTIAETIIENRCKSCSGLCKGCDLKDMFLRWEVEPYETYIENDKCPYAYK